MGWLAFSFECPCGHRYDDLVQGVDGRPDPCPACQGKKAVKAVTAANLARVNVPCYPGYQRMTAGYGHDARRPAEKAGRQVQVPRRVGKATI